MSLNTIKDKTITHFLNNWGSTTQVMSANSNDNFEGLGYTHNDAFVEIIVSEESDKSISASGGQIKKRSIGTIEISINVKPGSGTEFGESLSDQAASIFDNKKINGIFTTTNRKEQLGHKDDSWYLFLVIVSYEYDYYISIS